MHESLKYGFFFFNLLKFKARACIQYNRIEYGYCTWATNSLLGTAKLQGADYQSVNYDVITSLEQFQCLLLGKVG